MLMGFPMISFRLCDFWAIHEEKMECGVLRVIGELPGGSSAVAYFRPQAVPRGSWIADNLEEV